MRALVLLEANPVTLGELAAVAIAGLLERDILVVMNDSDGVLTTDQRETLLARAISRLEQSGIRVQRRAGRSLCDLCLGEECDTVVLPPCGLRGRSVSVEVEELKLRRLVKQCLQIEPTDEHPATTPSVLAELVSKGHDVSHLMPVEAKETLEIAIRGQWTVGVTGPIASGKSWVCERLTQRMNDRGIPCVHVSYDALVRDLYDEVSPAAERIRSKIADRFGEQTRRPDGSIDRKQLARRLFDPATPGNARAWLERLTMPHVERLDREQLAGFRGLVLVESATLLAMGLSGRVNNRIVVVDAPHRQNFLVARGIDDAFAVAVERHQMSAARIREEVERQIRKAGHGSVLTYENRSIGSEHSIERLADSIQGWFPDMTVSSLTSP